VDPRPAIQAARASIPSATSRLFASVPRWRRHCRLSFDKANNKIKIYTSGAVECANALDISSVKLYLYVKGN
jgi:hypothetical protein